MNTIVNNIKQRLSLREPLSEALEVVAKLIEKLTLKKPEGDTAYEAYLKEQLGLAQEVCPHCKNFERNFPSFAFSIATGIGKTRLMGACIAYLYLKKGIRHFFILAPNLTLYEKLIRDFGDTSYEKYVFKGLSEFVHNTPRVITGDNYNSAYSLFSSQEIQINIFNIAKFNSENRGGAPRMRRLAECIGQSYFDYLASLDDLVILMDEAHRYHADASKKAINELRPILGLEMTATPTDEKGKALLKIKGETYTSTDFDNIVDIIFKQNGIEHIDDSIQKEVRDAMDKAMGYKMQQNAYKMCSLEEQMICVLISTSMKLEDIYNVIKAR